jgi:hypothetical protein
VVDGEVRSLEGDLRREIVGLRDEYEAIWTGVVDSGIAEGVFHAADAKLARLSLLEMCNGVSRWYRASGRTDVARLAAATADLALGALRTTRQRRPISLADLDVPAPGALIDLVDATVDARQPGATGGRTAPGGAVAGGEAR